MRKCLGESYINYAGYEIHEKLPATICTCKKQCLSVFDDDGKNSMLEMFNQMKDKDQQGIYIERLMELHPVQRKRSRLEISAEQAEPKSKMVANILQKTCLSNASYGKNVPRANKSSFALSSYHQLTVSYSDKNEIKCREFINALVEHTFRLQNSTTGFLFSIDKAHNGKLPINEKKLEDIKNTLKFIPD
ncbi:Hypothetical protein CINCED_3A016490 [Cinara cedri]|uniref:Uncharacterized protein n=1 Tax=Cinara cedri TaxID=506608 RepID=A0A5E4NI82_9HEMI|nr:Hypothetical protein CINCED_3A016490 [Cinara cedri]